MDDKPVDDKLGKPVSMRKTPAAQQKVKATRPGSIVALALAMLLSGVAAVVAATTLYGQHDYLVRSLSKAQPDTKIAASTVKDVSSKVGTTFASDLDPLLGKKPSDTQISSVADKVGAALKSAIPNANVTDDQLNSQVDKTTSAVSAQLKDVSGSLTAKQATSQGTDLTKTVKDNLTDLRKSQLSPAEVNDKANKAPTGILTQNLLLFVALGLIGLGVYAGRYWGRWAVPVVWLLASFTGTGAGIGSLTQLGSDLPAGFKFGSAVSSAALIVAVLLGLLRPSKDWYAAHRPVMAAGGAQRRGLFAPRVPPPSTRSNSTRSTTRATQSKPAGRFGPKASVDPAAANEARSGKKSATDPARGSGARTNAARSKNRSAAQATSSGAAAARARAKTSSKSRRTTES